MFYSFWIACPFPIKNPHGIEQVRPVRRPAILMMKEKKMHLTKNKLWALRQEIVLNSLFVADYQNSLGYTRQSVYFFFDGYMDYLEELAIEEHGSDCSLEQIFRFDDPDNLYDWYGCFESCPFQREV